MEKDDTIKALEKEIRFFLFLFLLYLAVCCIPFDLLIKDNAHLVSGLSLASKAVFLVLLAVYLLREKGIRISVNRFTVFSLFLIPLGLACFSNVLYAVCTGAVSISSLDPVSLTIGIFQDSVVAAIEELLFRGILLYTLLSAFSKSQFKDLFSILISSAVFALSHLVNLFSNSPGVVFIQVGYTFILGVLLGMVYLMSRNIFFPTVGHFLFNLLNGTVFAAFFSISIDISYVLFSIAIGVIALSYCLICYYVFKRKEADHVS